MISHSKALAQGVGDACARAHSTSASKHVADKHRTLVALILAARKGN